MKGLGYSDDAIGRKLNKVPVTIKRYLLQDMTAISKAYGSKRNGSIHSPYYEKSTVSLEGKQDGAANPGARVMRVLLHSSGTRYLIKESTSFSCYIILEKRVNR